MKSEHNIQILEMRIKILSEKILEQSNTYDRMQNKMFAIVGLLVTVGGLLTYDAFKINFPDNSLEYIVFITALVFVAATASIIGYDYRAKKTWSVPIGPVEEERLDNAESYEKALLVVHKDYQLVYEYRDKSVDQKAKALNRSLYMFIISAILLIVLKIVG